MKPETGSRKRCKAWHIFDDRARSIGGRRQISIPDKKRGISRIGVRGLGFCEEQVEKVAPELSLSDSTNRRNTGLAARNNFLIERRREYTPELRPQLGREPAGGDHSGVALPGIWTGDLLPRHRRTRWIAISEREPISIRAQKTKKEMDGKNTGLVAENNFLIDAENPGRATDLEAKAYLAITWQRAEIEARFTCRDRRFPTPSPRRRNNREMRALLTTNHLLWPTQRWKRSLCYRFRNRIHSFSQRMQRERSRGRAVSRTDGPKSAQPKSSHGILWVIHPLLHSCFSKKCAAQRADAQWIPF
jgi:hypothetical protein